MLCCFYLLHKRLRPLPRPPTLPRPLRTPRPRRRRPRPRRGRGRDGGACGGGRGRCCCRGWRGAGGARRCRRSQAQRRSREIHNRSDFQFGRGLLMWDLGKSRGVSESPKQDFLVSAEYEPLVPRNHRTFGRNRIFGNCLFVAEYSVILPNIRWFYQTFGKFT